eukprot:TRINITY_DN84650_c0_g1_i1.p1 TRINITY_DN84650_c0_g1~~TRINITY_DN84650_c0_g1_i1.p1  ORF type:complete len:231 (-),score=19.07 TRINITY_DN84650_c0_g1_i1:418-1035(-)
MGVAYRCSRSAVRRIPLGSRRTTLQSSLFCGQERRLSRAAGQRVEPAGVAFGRSPLHGVGVFAAQSFAARDVVEVCPCLRITRKSLEMLSDSASADDTAADLRDYLFDPRSRKLQLQAAETDYMLLPMGCGLAYNHGEGTDANLQYQHIEEDSALVFTALRAIRAGEELLVDYGDTWWRDRGVRPITGSSMSVLRQRMALKQRRR